MLTRIAVIGDNKKLSRALGDALAGRDAELAPLAADGEVPPGSVAVVSGVNDAAAAARAALKLGDWNGQLLTLLCKAIDCREGMLLDNSTRVLEHATRFAQALALSPGDQLLLERGALVRDIGKIMVPNDTLLKSSPLTYDEWALIHQHPHLGAKLILETGALKDTADIVRNHHECYDGDGYPDGLEGEAIPYLARIMKILDVYCAMTSPRHYRKGHASHKEAVEHLRNERGKHFDPDLVDVFVKAKVGRTKRAP